VSEKVNAALKALSENANDSILNADLIACQKEIDIAKKSNFESFGLLPDKKHFICESKEANNKFEVVNKYSMEIVKTLE